MPFDPTYPPANALIDSAPLRDQFTSLKALIDAIVSVTGAQVLSTATLNPGQPATATVALVGSTLRFTFGIPRGNNGATGPQGPPFAGAVVDNVSTLDPNDPAYVNVNFDGNDVRFDFGIPRGFDGPEGPQGSDGPEGPQGPPGEVSLADLQNAIDGTSANSNGVDFLGMIVSDPPTQAEVQQIADKVDELISALRR